MPSSYEVDKLWVSVNYNNRLRILTEIRDVFVDVAYRNNHHLLGANFFTEQQSTSFTKDKLALVYAYRIDLTSESQLSMGSRVGVSAIRFDASEVDAGGSDQSLDLTLSGTYQYDQFTFGIALHQLQNSKLQPATEIFSLQRYIEVLTSYKITIDDGFEYQLGASFQKSNNDFFWRTDHMISYQKAYGLFTSWGNRNFYSIGAFLQLKDPYPINISASFNDFYKGQNVNKSTISIQVSYSI